MPVLSLKRIADECDFDVIDYFIESKTPSRMYKEIVKPEAVDRITEKDRAFDEILRLPQNMDKLKYLYHASEAIQLMQKTDITNYHADNLVDGVNDILIETKTPNSSRNIELLGEYIKQFNQNLK
ncbi:hypothetical protein SAMN02910292_01152 [Lachnospiraceae bacterium XBB2008]|nr:hypothetical protein SAMN02910292_01152 [Lachnospiraceae bacterium XBB2008]